MLLSGESCVFHGEIVFQGEASIFKGKIKHVQFFQREVVLQGKVTFPGGKHPGGSKTFFQRETLFQREQVLQGKVVTCVSRGKRIKNFQGKVKSSKSFRGSRLSVISFRGETVLPEGSRTFQMTPRGEQHSETVQSLYPLRPGGLGCRNKVLFPCGKRHWGAGPPVRQILSFVAMGPGNCGPKSLPGGSIPSGEGSVLSMRCRKLIVLGLSVSYIIHEPAIPCGLKLAEFKGRGLVIHVSAV